MKKKKPKKRNPKDPKKRKKDNSPKNKEHEYIKLPKIFSLTTIDLIAVTLIAGFFGCIYLTNINAYDSLMYDEAQFMTMGRTIANEHYHGIDVQGTKDYVRPPLFPSMIALSYLIFGTSYTAAKIPIFLTAIATMIITYLFIRKIYKLSKFILA